MNPGVFSGSGSGGALNAPTVSGFIRDTAVLSPAGSVGAGAAAARAKSFTVATSAGVWKEMISVSGRGCVNWAAIATNTSTNLSFEFEIDGVVVQSVGPLLHGSNDGVCIVGGIFYNTSSADCSVTFQPVYFQSSFKIRVLPSLASTTFVYINAEIYR